MGHQHTPGPWKANIYDGGAFEIISESPKYVAPGMVVAGRNGYPGWGHAEESAANARLIAAAPDLLGLLEEIARMGQETSVVPLQPSFVSVIRTAISKAKGE